jgi:Family of unknown function (DUF5994)
MLTTAGRYTAIIPAPPSRPRLRMQPDLSARTLLDRGWWSRSADPVAELPGPVLAIEKRHGLIIRIMLGKAGWDADGPAGSRVVRLGWFGTIPAELLTAIARAGRTGSPGRHGPGRPGRQPYPRPRSAGRHHHGRHPGPPASRHLGWRHIGQHPVESRDVFGAARQTAAASGQCGEAAGRAVSIAVARNYWPAMTGGRPFGPFRERGDMLG